MKLTILTLLIVSFVITVSKAQETTPVKLKNHSAGLIGGSTTGYGLSYRYRSDYNFGLQVSYGPYKNQNQFKQFISFAFIYDLVKNKKSNFYLYQSNGFWHTKNTYTDYYYPQLTTTEYTYSEWNHAIGVGMEFTIHDVVGINFMTGYGSYENFNYISFSGEFGVYYKF